MEKQKTCIDCKYFRRKSVDTDIKECCSLHLIWLSFDAEPCEYFKLKKEKEKHEQK